MKAYLLSLANDDDAGAAVVFAETGKEAKKKVYGTTLGDSVERWIDVRVRRDKRYDGLEKLTPAQLAKEQWRDGWRWFDLDYPDPDEATDDEFIAWYEDVFPPTPERLKGGQDEFPTISVPVELAVAKLLELKAKAYFTIEENESRVVDEEDLDRLIERFRQYE